MLTRPKASNIHAYSPPRWCPWDLFRYFKFCLDAEERVGSKSNGKLPHQFTSNETATLVPDFAVEDLPLGRTAALVPSLQWKICPCAEHSDDDDDDDDDIFYKHIFL